MREAGKLIGDGTSAGDQYDASRRLKQSPCGNAHEVGAKRVDGALRKLFAEAWPRLTASYRGLDRDLKILHVGGAMLVDDD